MKIRFDVNDASLRDTFLKTFFFGALDGLRPESRASWGRMSAQQMVEHVLWAFEGSTGRVEIACSLPPEKASRFTAFLYDNRPTPAEFMNPALVDGLPPLRFADLGQARKALLAEVDLFLDQARRQPETTRTHPIFGPLTLEEWSRTHFKHVCHHLLQFGLAELEP
jgi:oxepin-CoA hydrolase/3-oxo-5,6-dehydrosuberyl-CoA semialdehyde dehydrogenase